MNTFYEWIAIPFGWLLGLLYEISDNYLLSLLIITLVTRLILLPSTISQQKNSAKQMRLQAKVNKIRAKYAGQQSRDVQMKISQETQELYQREGFNPSQMGCLPMAIQLVVMMGLYGAIYAPLSKVLRLSTEVMTNLKDAYAAFSGADLSKNTRYELDILHHFDELKASLDPNIITADVETKIHSVINGLNIFGIDLTQKPNEDIKSLLILVPVFAGLSALLTSAFTYFKQRKTNPEMAKNPMMGCMSFSSPLISVIFAYTLPAGIGFYWIISNILSFIQIVALHFLIKPEDVIAQQMIDETVQRRSREKNIKEIKKIMAEKNKE